MVDKINNDIKTILKLGVDRDKVKSYKIKDPDFFQDIQPNAFTVEPSDYNIHIFVKKLIEYMKYVEKNNELISKARSDFDASLRLTLKKLENFKPRASEGLLNPIKTSKGLTIEVHSMKLEDLVSEYPSYFDTFGMTKQNWLYGMLIDRNSRDRLIPNFGETLLSEMSRIVTECESLVNSLKSTLTTDQLFNEGLSIEEIDTYIDFIIELYSTGKED